MEEKIKNNVILEALSQEPAKKNIRRKQTQAEWEADPKKHEFAVKYTQTGSLKQAAELTRVPYVTARNWKSDQRFHIALQRILDERKSGLHKAARVVDEAMDAIKTISLKEGGIIEESDHKTRLIAARLVMEIYRAIPGKMEQREEDKEALFDDAIFEDVVLDAPADDQKEK